MKSWRVPAAWTAACGAIIAGAVLWDLAIKPQPSIPEVTGDTFYATPGLHTLLNTARLRDDQVDPKYTVRVTSADSERLREQLLHLGPKLGWYTQEGRPYNDIRATMPEQDIAEVERMVRDPVAWVLENTKREAAGSADQKRLINVTIDIDSTHGRTLWPIWAMVAGSVGLIFKGITVLMIVADNAERPNRTAKAKGA